MSPADLQLWARVKRAFDAAGPRPPTLHHLAEALALERSRLEAFLIRMTRHGLVARVSENRFFLVEQLAALERLAAELAAQAGDGFEASQFRDRTALGRNLAIEVLEHFDRTGITVLRNGRRRVRAARRRAQTEAALS